MTSFYISFTLAPRVIAFVFVLPAWLEHSSVYELYRQFKTNVPWILTAQVVLFVAFLALLAFALLRIQREVRALRPGAARTDLIAKLEHYIQTRCAQRREPDSQLIDTLLRHRLGAEEKILRGFVNGFVVIGVMGTLFTLYEIWRSSGKDLIDNPATALSRMSGAFGASFFGLSFALFCSIFLLSPLTRIIDEASNRFHIWILDSSGPTPKDPLEHIVETFHETTRKMLELSTDVAAAIGTSRTENKSILEHMSEVVKASTSTIDKALDEIKNSSSALKVEVTSSLDRLKIYFEEISKSWNDQLQQTTKSTQVAAEQIASAANSLAKTLADVGAALTTITQAFDRVRRLDEIAEQVRQTTGDYLKQTEEQFRMFKDGMNTILHGARSIPDEWHTALHDRNTRLTMQLQDIIRNWKKETDDVSNRMHTQFEETAAKFDPLIKLLAPEGALTKTLMQFNHVVDGAATVVTDLGGGIAPIHAKLSQQHETLLRLESLAGEIHPSAPPSIILDLTSVNDSLGRIIDTMRQMHSAIQGSRPPESSIKIPQTRHDEPVGDGVITSLLESMKTQLGSISDNLSRLVIRGIGAV